MNEMLNPVIDVDLGANGGRRVYRNVEELQEWFKAENAFWDWLRQTNWDQRLARRYSQQMSHFGIDLSIAHRSSTIQVKALNQIGTAIAGLAGKPEELAEKIKGISALLLGTYAYTNAEAPNAIHSASVAGKAIDQLNRERPELAIYALAYFLNKRAEITSSIEVEAIFRCILYEQGIAGTAEAEREALEGVYTEFTGQLAEAKKGLKILESNLSETAADEKARGGARQQGFDTFMHDSQNAVSKLVESSKQELTSIEKTYNEKLALQASVSYWTKKAKKHTCLAFAFAVMSVSAFVGGGAALFNAMKLVVGEASLNDVQLWKLGVLTMLATVVVWAIRVLVRLFMSNVHLHDDAEERTTMLLTYLAMLRAGKLPEGDVRQLILQALFRPAATGIVRDDAAPPFMAQWLKLTTGSDT